MSFLSYLGTRFLLSSSWHHLSLVDYQAIQESPFRFVLGLAEKEAPSPEEADIICTFLKSIAAESLEPVLETHVSELLGALWSDSLWLRCLSMVALHPTWTEAALHASLDRIARALSLIQIEEEALLRLLLVYHFEHVPLVSFQDDVFGGQNSAVLVRSPDILIAVMQKKQSTEPFFQLFHSFTQISEHHEKPKYHLLLVALLDPMIRSFPVDEKLQNSMCHESELPRLLLWPSRPSSLPPTEGSALALSRAGASRHAELLELGYTVHPLLVRLAAHPVPWLVTCLSEPSLCFVLEAQSRWMSSPSVSSVSLKKWASSLPIPIPKYVVERLIRTGASRDNNEEDRKEEDNVNVNETEDELDRERAALVYLEWIAEYLKLISSIVSMSKKGSSLTTVAFLTEYTTGMIAMIWDGFRVSPYPDHYVECILEPLTRSLCDRPGSELQAIWLSEWKATVDGAKENLQHRKRTPKSLALVTALFCFASRCMASTQASVVELALAVAQPVDSLLSWLVHDARAWLASSLIHFYMALSRHEAQSKVLLWHETLTGQVHFYTLVDMVESYFVMPRKRKKEKRASHRDDKSSDKGSIQSLWREWSVLWPSELKVKMLDYLFEVWLHKKEKQNLPFVDMDSLMSYCQLLLGPTLVELVSGLRAKVQQLFQDARQEALPMTVIRFASLICLRQDEAWRSILLAWIAKQETLKQDTENWHHVVRLIQVSFFE